MSQYPPPPVQPPIDYAVPSLPTPPRRPTSVTVLSIIGIILAAMGVICTPLGLIQYFVDFGQPNPVIDAIKENKIAFAWTIGSNILTILLSVVLLAGSIGSLKLAGWARSSMLAYAAMSLLMMLAGTIIHILVLKPLMDEAYKQIPGAAGMASFIMIFTIAIVLLSLTFLGSILYFYNTPRVKDAFANPPEAVI